MNSEVAINENDLCIIEKSLDTFKEAGTILRSNQERAIKAVAIGSKILADWEANGRQSSPELDQRMQNYLANCNTAKTAMNDSRKIFTQTLDIIKSAFTEEEKKLDVKDKAAVAFQIQQIRDNYAKQVHEEEQKRQREIELQKQKDQEAINIKAEAEKRLSLYVGQAIATEKMRINTAFNGITLETFDVKSNSLKAMQPVYAYAHFQQFQHGITSRLIAPADIDTLLKTHIESKFQQLADDYKAQVTELQNFLIERLPSKKQELLSIKQMEEEREAERIEQERIQKEQAQANDKRRAELEQERLASVERQRLADEEQRRLKAEQDQREEQERKRLAHEEAQRQRDQEQAIENNKEVETTMALFGTEVATADAVSEKPEARMGYEIEVTGTAGWMQIFQLWFNETGKSLDNEKISSTKMEAMRTFCEKLAHKDPSKKINSNFLVYKESFKAVNRKVRA